MTMAINEVTKRFICLPLQNKCSQPLIENVENLGFVDVFVGQFVQARAIAVTAQKQAVLPQRFADQPNLGQVRSGTAIGATRDTQRYRFVD